MNIKFKHLLLVNIIFLLLAISKNGAMAQRGGAMYWANDGYQYYTVQGGQIVKLMPVMLLRKPPW